jgi:hypothetical protein
MSLTKKDLKNVEDRLSKRIDMLVEAMVDRFDQIDRKFEVFFKMHQEMEKKMLKLNAKQNMTSDRLDRTELSVSAIIKALSEPSLTVKNSFTIKDKDSKIKYKKKE